MTGNETLYRIGFSGLSALIIGVLGGVVGLAWAAWLGAPDWTAAALAALAGVWGAVVVHLTPTGGTITENRTTVNYAVFALHAWYAVFLCIVALLVLAMRSWAF